MQAALDGAFGDRGRLGGLLDRLALVDHGGDGRPLLVGEVGDGGADAGRGVRPSAASSGPVAWSTRSPATSRERFPWGWRRARLASRRRAIPHSQAGTAPVPW